MYKFCFYVPDSHVESVKQAIFATGAGAIENYSDCCWQVLGQGQFKPQLGSDPFTGEVGTLATVTEWKVEMVVADELIHAAVAALKAAHPYEVPAFDVWRLSDMLF